MLTKAQPRKSDPDLTRWSEKKAWEWHHQTPWQRGCNYIPSTAINQLEMWQPETFDSLTISRELALARSIGFNSMRVYLHHQAWLQDPDAFKKRLACYLQISSRNGISTTFVFFDDCWNATYHAGKQPDPKPGVHNSGWIRDPGDILFTSPDIYKTLEAYVKDILTAFKDDKRILMWDLYNEPGNSGYGNKTFLLLQMVFQWSREIGPMQPVTSGVWRSDLTEINRFQLQNSDVISYHNYLDSTNHAMSIDTLKKYNRPLMCTEYLARPRNSSFEKVLPLLKSQKIGAYNWGFVSGKTNTIYAYHTVIPDGTEPAVWFHDIFRKDFSPYDSAEIVFIKRLTGVK